MQTPSPTAQFIAQQHSRAEKSALLDPDADVLHERRRAHRMLASVTWPVVMTITVECMRLAFAIAGGVWFLAYVLGSLRAGVWL